MTCFHFQIGDSQGIVTISDAVEGSEGKWRWEFDERFGPTWLKKNGDPRKCQNPGKAAWAAFDRWYEEYRKEHPRAESEGSPLAID